MPDLPKLSRVQKTVAGAAGLSALIILAVSLGYLAPKTGQYSIGGMDPARTFNCAQWDTLLIIRAADSTQIKFHGDTILVPSDSIHVDSGQTIQLAMLCSGSKLIRRLPYAH
jgi:hypothetical protein